MKKITLIIPILLITSVCFGQTKPKNTKIYYVPFTEQQYLSFFNRAMHADSLLSQSESKAWQVTPAINIIQEMQNIFGQAYMRGDTLITTPFPVKKGGK